MKQVLLDIPTFGFIVVTRAALGVGVGLLLASRIPNHRRQQAAMALIGLGAATTVPAVMALVKGSRIAQRGADAW
jgi:hypothetical protein